MTTKSTTKTSVNDVIESHKFMFMAKEYSALDVATKAIAVKKKAEGYEAEKSILGKMFVNMARTCKNVEEFLNLCGAVEARKSWKSEQNPQGSKSASEVVPAWTQYKSNIKTAWSNFGIKPTDYDSTGKLNKLLNEARKAKKAADNASNGDSLIGESIDAAAKVDQRLANILDKFTKLFGECDSDSQEIILEDLADTYNKIVAGVDEDLTDELAKTVNTGTHQESAKQAQAH